MIPSLSSLLGGFLGRYRRPGIGSTAYLSAGAGPPHAPRLDADSALTLTAVYNAINRISGDLSSFRPIVKRWDDKLGALVPDHTHPVARVLRESWDGQRTAILARRDAMQHVLAWGQSLGVIFYDDYGSGSGIRQVHPERFRAEYTEDGEIVYRIRGVDEPLRSSKVLHFRGLSVDGLNGKSPIELAAASLGLYASAEAYAEAMYRNGGLQRGFVCTDAPFDQVKFNQLQAAVNSGGVDQALGWGVLMGGATATPIQMSAEATQLIASRIFSIGDVARIYNIPPHKLGEHSHSTFSNIGSLQLDYTQGTLMPISDMADAEISLKLFTRAERELGYCVESDASPLLRADLAERSNFYATMLDRGVFTINDVLRKEGEPPIGPEGDHRLVQLNQTTVPNVAHRPAPPHSEES